MAADKRNVYLDVEDSDGDDNQSYDSEADELRKGNDRSSKRRKLEDDGDDNEEEDGIGGSDDEGEDGFPDEGKAEKKQKQKPNDASLSSAVDGKKRKKRTAEDDEDDEDEDRDEDAGSGSKKRKLLDSAGKDLPGVSRPLTKKNLVASAKAVQRSGVVYLSRVPPFMKPIKLRSLLTPYGAINRIFLSPEDPLSHARRVRGGGNKKRSFVDGWVEFVRKRDAKRAVDLLNGHTIGGKKSSYYRDDMWNLVYLRGFKWYHLTEQITTENAEREGRMRAEVAQSTLENKEFVRNVERAKMLDGIESKTAEKKNKKNTAKSAKTDSPTKAKPDNSMGDDQADGAVASADTEGQKNSRTFTFKQTSLVSRKDRAEQPEQVKRVLSKIF